MKATRTLGLALSQERTAGRILPVPHQGQMNIREVEKDKLQDQSRDPYRRWYGSVLILVSFIFGTEGIFPVFAGTTADIQSLVRDLAPCLKHTPRSYRFYHYAELAAIERTRPPGMSLDHAIRDHAILWSDYYWSTNKKINDLTGLYTATDPFSSASFGKEDFYLYRIEIPAGTVYYENPERNCQLSRAGKAALAHAQCPTDSLDSFIWANSNEPGCMNLRKNIFSQLHLRGITSSWLATVFSICDKRPDKDFIWFDLHGLLPGSIQLFRPTPPPIGDPARKEAVEINQMYGAIHYIPDSAAWPVPLPWPGLLEESKLSRIPIKQILGEKIFGCEHLAVPSAQTLTGMPCETTGSGLDEKVRSVLTSASKAASALRAR